MNLPLRLDEMTTADKIATMELIWEDLCRNPENLPSPAWHEQILIERQQQVQESNEIISDCKEAKHRIRESL